MMLNVHDFSNVKCPICGSIAPPYTSTCCPVCGFNFLSMPELDISTSSIELFESEAEAQKVFDEIRRTRKISIKI